MNESQYSHRQQQLSNQVTRYTISSSTQSLTYAEVIELWRSDSTFRDYFISLLRDSPFSAYRWETPRLNSHCLDREFEFVLINSPALARPVDAHAFANQFRQADANVTVLRFSNLSGDAALVVPLPKMDEAAGDDSAYGHLASFTRQAPEIQNDDFWQQVGEAMAERISDRPIWLNTAGMGVSWLHVRLDSRPKYYHHQPYRNEE